MAKLRLPGRLVTSLTDLGLLDSEAKIYAALALLDYADVGDLVKTLDISKPRIYTSLGTLEARGLIVQTSPRPAIYQAVAPKIALEMMVKHYEDVKNEAMDQFRIADKLELAEKQQPPLYHIFGEKSLKFKIQDMLENARKSVHCLTSEKYLKHVERMVKKDVKLNLVVKSEDPGLRDRLARMFRKGNAQIQMIDDRQFMKRGSSGSGDNRQRVSRAELVDMDALFILITDDAEALFILPVKSESVNAISSTNPAIIYLIGQALERNLAPARSRDG